MRKIFFFLILFFCLLSIIRSVSSMYTLWKKRDLIVQAQKQLIQAQNKHALLNQQQSVVQNQSFIEEEARNKLFLAKQGEQTVIISQDLLFSTEKAPIHVNSAEPYWRQWLSLFFY